MKDYYPEKNLILCGNQEFIIMIDELLNKKIRYRCWRRPKTISDLPDLILLNGKTQAFEPNDKIAFLFNYGEWSYVLEKIISKEQNHSLVFLEVNNCKDQTFTWKLQEFGFSSTIFKA